MQYQKDKDLFMIMHEGIELPVKKNNYLYNYKKTGGKGVRAFGKYLQ